MIEAYLGLFASAFLAATVLPFSSEAVLSVMIIAGDYSNLGLLVIASLGNILGAVVNWGLGKYCLHWQHKRWFPVKAQELERAGKWFNRYGSWSLLLAWVPIIGDPITFAAGVFKTKFPLFLILVTISKTGRYLVVLYIAKIFQ